MRQLARPARSASVVFARRSVPALAAPRAPPLLGALRARASSSKGADDASSSKKTHESPAAEKSAKEAAASGAEAAEEEESASDDPTDTRGRVLEAAMLQVPEHGWSMDALTAGAAACGLSPQAHGLLPRGPVELVEHFCAACDEKLATEMSERATELEGLEAHNRLLVAMQTRLRMVAPYATSWPQALALRALPNNLPNTLGDGHRLATLLLTACGEDARAPLVPQPIDPMVKIMSVSAPRGAAASEREAARDRRPRPRARTPTRGGVATHARAQIGAIYGAAELHLLTDRSAELTDTWTFVEREVEALRSVASAKSQLPDLSPANLILSLLTRPR